MANAFDRFLDGIAEQNSAVVNRKVVEFPSPDSLPSLASRKVAILEVLREVLANEPQCYLKAPVDVLEIFSYRVPAAEMGIKNPLTTWILAAYSLEGDGLVRTWSRLKKTRAA